MEPVAPAPLARNRDFLLLQSGQLLSNAGTQATSIAYPLLVLALTHSAGDAGIVGFVRSAGVVACTLPAGAAADRWARRTLMIAADGLRLAAVAGLGVTLVVHGVVLWGIAVVALVEGAGTAIFTSAQAGAVRSVVPPSQLPAAAAAQSGRRAAVQLVGPPLGGALFGLARSLPFLVDAGSYLLSTASLLAMRTPFQQERAADPAPLRRRVAEGFRFLWSQPFLRTSALAFGAGNFIGPGLLLALVVVARRHGLAAGAVGGLVATFGASVLAGALLSAVIRRRLRPRQILLTELWAATAVVAFLAWPSPYVLAASLIPTALVIPSSDSVVHGYRIAMTPDRLLGRAEAARSLVSLSFSPLGPLVAGFLLEVSARVAVAVFGSVAVALAVWGTLSPALRVTPPLEEVEWA
ncbi:MAG TPA: MFS transporter [Acidimicrobiales bacterium]|nr:MFS transporter [Acidimicrobiales bacterium]